MQLKLPLFLMMLLTCAQPALANDSFLKSVPNAEVVGRGTLSYALWDIYEATLYAPEGQLDSNNPLALSIRYFYSIEGKHIADKSVQEMRKQGMNDEIKLAAWNAQMKSIFPDVKDGTVLAAVYTPGSQTMFYNGNKPIGAIKGDEFSRLFFGIWLSEKTSEPVLRRALLGAS